MARKAKRAEGRGNGSRFGVSVLVLLVTASLIVGASHDPLRQLMFNLLSSETGGLPAALPEAVAEQGTQSNSPSFLNSLISRKTDWSVLNVAIGNDLRIEYLLVPAPAQIASIHQRAMYDIACALRTVGPARRSTILVGVGRFVNAEDQPVLRTRIESALSALELNRIDCTAGSRAEDVDWNRVSEYQVSFAIRPGLRVDF